MGKKKDAKNGRFASRDAFQLTKTQLEIMHYLTEEFLTPKQISIRRKTKLRAVQKIIKKLKKNGYINKYFQKTKKRGCTRRPNHKIRLHSEEFNIQILFKDNRYKELLNKSNIFIMDGNTIRLFNDSLEIYSGKFFYGSNTKDCNNQSSEYWHTFFQKLENKLNIIIIKDGYLNIRKVKEHYAEINNELAKDMHKKGELLRIKDKEDDKTWLIIDNSHGLHELETVHPVKSKGDMDKIKPFFDDLRNNPVTISEIMQLIKQIASQHIETATGLHAIVKLLQPNEVKDNEKNKTIPDYIN